MEKLDYPELVQQILTTRTENRSHNDTETHLIFDRERDRYQVLHIGWQDMTRVFGCLIYIVSLSKKTDVFTVILSYTAIIATAASRSPAISRSSKDLKWVLYCR